MGGTTAACAIGGADATNTGTEGVSAAAGCGVQTRVSSVLAGETSMTASAGASTPGAEYLSKSIEPAEYARGRSSFVAADGGAATFNQSRSAAGAAGFGAIFGAADSSANARS